MSEQKQSYVADEPHAQDERHESHVKTYMKVFVTLTILTAVEYFYAHFAKDSFAVLVVGLMILAIIKAGLVGMFFMHLKFEGRWVYYMLVPAGILAVILVLALFPDVAMQPESDEPVGEDETAATAPVEPGALVSR